MTFLFASIAAIIVLGFCYRLRGGGYFELPTTTDARLVWSGGLAASYALLVLRDVSFYEFVALFAAGFLSMLVPHGYCQNLGRWASPQKKWPSFFMPTYTQEEWDAKSLAKRELYDFVQMMSVAAIRGAIVFGLYTLVAIVFGHDVLLSPFVALAVIAGLQPSAYWVGWRMPFSLPGAMAKSAEWGELLTGAAWAASLIVLTL